MSGTDEKNDEDIGAEESETIALSSNELDDILSEAEIVQEKAKKAENPTEETPEESKEEFDIPLTEEEFDISDEIEQKEDRVPPKTAVILEFYGHKEYERGDMLTRERTKKLMIQLKKEGIVRY